MDYQDKTMSSSSNWGDDLSDEEDDHTQKIRVQWWEFNNSYDSQSYVIPTCIRHVKPQIIEWAYYYVQQQLCGDLSGVARCICNNVQLFDSGWNLRETDFLIDGRAKNKEEDATFADESIPTVYTKYVHVPNRKRSHGKNSYFLVYEKPYEPLKQKKKACSKKREELPLPNNMFELLEVDV